MTFSSLCLNCTQVSLMKFGERLAQAFSIVAFNCCLLVYLTADMFSFKCPKIPKSTGERSQLCRGYMSLWKKNAVSCWRNSWVRHAVWHDALSSCHHQFFLNFLLAYRNTFILRYLLYVAAVSLSPSSRKMS